jgi:hypothetical protein
MSDNPMTSVELIKARTWLGFSADRLAADLGLPPAIIAAWESDRDKIPAHIAEDLRWRAALAERLAALETSGVPECEWMRALEAKPVPTKQKAVAARYEEVIAHGNGCPTCLAREQFITDHFPPMPPRPMPASMRVLAWIVKRAEPLPRWAQPAVPMAVAFGAYSLVRILFLLPRIFARPELALTAVEGLGASMAIGGGLGALYGLFRMARERFAARRTA